MKSKEKTIYHGSDHTMEMPIFSGGRPDNDYGMGFYCTEVIDLAREWASVTKSGGFVNKYIVDESGLKILDLSSHDFNALNWLAILLNNRSIRLSSLIEEDGRRYIIDHYLPDTKDADVIIGYSADDSFFSFARAFLSNTLSYQQLSQILKYGDLGLQYVLISRKAFDSIRFVSAELVDGEIYYPLRNNRDNKAREAYRRLVRELDRDGLFLNQIMRGEAADERL